MVHGTREAIKENLKPDTKISDEGRNKTNQLAATAEKQIVAHDEIGLEKTHQMVLAIYFEEQKYSVAACFIINWSQKEPEFKNPAQGRQLIKQGLACLDLFDGGERFIIKNKEGLLAAMAGLLAVIVTDHSSDGEPKKSGVQRSSN